MTRVKKSRKVNNNGPARPPREKRDDKFKTGKRKGKGQATGSRHSGIAVKSGGPAATTTKDPRHGSKKPIALTIDKPQAAPLTTAMNPEKELAQLENSPRLSQLLDKVEGGEILSQADQFWLDNTLARIAVLMDELGIDDELPEEDEQPQRASESDEIDLLDQFEQGSNLLDQYKD